MSRKNLPTREAILEAAWKMLESSPHKAVRVGDIAREAGISRQALYLHYPTRAELLIATARYIDEVKKVDERLAASRAATGIARLDAFIEAWGGYIPEIYGIGRAFMAMMDTDEAARAAWGDRMQAVRHGCAAAVRALKEADALNPDHTETTATDLLWTLLSVRNWEQLTIECGWTQTAYLAAMQQLSHTALVSPTPLQPSGGKD